MQHDAPSYVANMCFEISPEPEVPVSTGAYITETDMDLEMDSKDNYPSELYDMFEVFAIRKTNPAPSTIPAPAVLLASAASMTTLFPLTHHMRTPQYRYQASAEDQALIKQAMDWFLKGKLDQITQAHVLAISPLIHKELVERLCSCHVETGSFEEIVDKTEDPVSVLELAAKH